MHNVRFFDPPPISYGFVRFWLRNLELRSDWQGDLEIGHRASDIRVASGKFLPEGGRNFLSVEIGRTESKLVEMAERRGSGERRIEDEDEGRARARFCRATKPDGGPEMIDVNA